jgi:hypothetical protein
VAKIKIDFDDRQLKRNLTTFSNKVNRNIAAVMDYNAAYTTGWLKANAPWTDDTSAARTGLVTLPFSFGTQHELLMAYSVSYGIWLEIANSGRYAVITPAMRIVGEKIMRDMQMLIDSMI